MAEVIEGDEEWHGTAGGYTNHKCRGPKCREAWAATMRDYKKRKKEQPDSIRTYQKKTDE
jgi:hypothetical protein